MNHFKALDEWVAAQPPPNKNPMVRKHGRDPQGRKCGDCALLVGVDHGSKNFYKCAKRGISRSEATDHRLKWDACRLFKAKGGV